jgi:tRNA pseudouridine(55) synthase
LLAICVGKATAAVQFMDTYDKTYQVRVLFGTATDTMDLTGTVTGSHAFVPGELSRLAAEDFKPVRQAVRGLPGEKQQIPPMYSAVKIDGQPCMPWPGLARQSNARVDRSSSTRRSWMPSIASMKQNPVAPGYRVT